jgi:hypothetical protein
MQHAILILSAEKAASANYDRLSTFLFPLLSALALLCALLSARFRASVSAVFLHPLSERTVIAKSGKRFLVFAEKETDDPDDPDDNEDQGEPGPDSPPSSGQPEVGSAYPATTTGYVSQGRAKRQGSATGTGERARDH